MSRLLTQRFVLIRSVIVAVAAALIGPLLTHVPAAGASAAGTTAPIGVYRGPGQWGADKVAAYEDFLGRPVQYALDFQDVNSWSAQTWPDWQAKAWAGRTVVLGASGVFPGGWNRTYNGQQMGWAQAARGDYDAYWRQFGERLVANGQAGAILRGAHEFNGSWYSFRVQEGEQAHFIAAWRRWVGVMRSVPGNRFTFDWNPTLGVESNLAHPETAYPGNQWVDRVGVDVYDGWYNRGWVPGVDAPPSTAEQDAVWSTMLNGPRGLVFWRDFAKANGKPLSIPEWGLRVWRESNGKVHGGGDNPRFVRRMHDIITDPAWNIDYHAFWEDPSSGGRGVADADTGREVPVPQARAVFRQLFVGGVTAPAAPSAPSTPEAPAPATTVATPETVVVNDSVKGTGLHAFAYAGTWHSSPGVAPMHELDNSWSTQAGATATFRFRGDQVALFGSKAPNHGRLTIRLDGRAPVTVDQYAATRAENVQLFRSPVLPEGEHTVTVTVSGTRNTASAGTAISLDRAVVTQPVVTNDSVTGTGTHQFDYSGSWHSSPGGAPMFQLDNRWSTERGASTTFRFRGTQVALRGALAPNHGRVTVRVDGGPAVTVDQYSATRREDVQFFRSAVLPAGDHTVVLTVSGTRNASSSGTAVALDRAVVR